MFLLSKKRSIKQFIRYCKAWCYNSLSTTKNDKILDKKTLPNNIHFTRKYPNLFIEIIKASCNKFKKKNINNEVSHVSKALQFCENNNDMIHTESLYKEILMSMSVLHYKDSEVDSELNYLRNYLKEKKTDVNPYELCGNTIQKIDEYIINIIKTNYKNIDEFTTYIYLHQGKKFRVILSVLLKNILSLIKDSSRNSYKSRNTQRNSSKLCLNSNGGDDNSYSSRIISNSSSGSSNGNVNNAPKRIAKRTLQKSILKEQMIEHQRKVIAASEVIHMGSLLHDDIIDDSNKRREVLSLHKKYSNKIAILTGDFLLARAGSVFADTENPEICKKFAYVIGNLIKGEFLQLNLIFNNIEDAMKIYLIKTYYKTASLFSNLFACVAILSSKNENIIKLCFNLGLHIGMAFQLYDDYLDYKKDKISDKPILNDIKNNIKTAPLLFSYNYNPKVILSLINKKSLSNHDISTILFYINNHNCMKRTELCFLLHIKKASDILSSISSYSIVDVNKEKYNLQNKSIHEYSSALVNLVINILSRNTK